MYPQYVIATVGAAFTLGRLLHYLAFAAKEMNFKLRVLGMQLTLFPLLILAGLNLYAYVSIGLFGLPVR